MENGSRDKAVRWVRESLVLLNMKAESDVEAIREIGELMVRESVVKESWINAAIEREKVFATGLPTQEVGVAIPHADAEHVLEQAIAVGVLDHPVSFGEMGSEGDRVEVRIVCALAVVKSEMLISLLNQLVEMFQQPGVLSIILQAKGPGEVVSIFDQHLK